MQTSYQLDRSDRIVAVDGAWIAFARQNDAGDLPDRVLRRPLWDFIADPTVRELYRLLLARVRDHRRSVALPFRCDSPRIQRFMRLEIARSPGPSGALSLRATLLRTAPQPEGAPAVFAALVDECSPARQPLVAVRRMCSWCKRLDADGWRDIADALLHDETLLTEPVRPITHGLCPDCERRILETMS